MRPFEFRLFGGCQARAAGQQIDVSGRKERALLAFLAMSGGQPRSRDGLCGLLWSERGEKQARDSLKQAIHRLRSSFEPVLPLPLLADRASLQLDHSAITVDSLEFEKLVGMGSNEALEHAAALYQGDLLDGLDVRNAAFEEWLLIERQRLRSRLHDALAILLDRYAAANARDQAIVTARRLLALDPLREAAHRALMRFYAAQGQKTQALKQYQRCRDTLLKDLGVGPEAETEKLYQTIKEGREGKHRTLPERTSAEVMHARSERTQRQDGQRASPSGGQSLASIPSIAVLPFANLSGDPGQEYYADGVTEDVITELSRWRTLAVLSRYSTFGFKNTALDARRIGGELGARFLVEGSVRRLGNRLRITAQLIDAETSKHIWAERFDRPLEDLFGLQDEIVRTIVGTLAGRVHVSEMERVGRKPPSSHAAYDLTLRGNALSWDDPDSAAMAKRAFERAIKIDPGYARPYSLLATLLGREWRNNLSGSDGLLERALELAQRGVVLADNDSTCHTALGYIHFERHHFDLALRHYERGVEINPSNPWNQVDLGYLLSYIGRAHEALDILRNARRKDPFLGPPWYWRSLGVAQFVLRRHADALADFDRGSANCPRYALAMMAGCCAMLGFHDRARELSARCLAGYSGAGVASLLTKVPFRDPADRDHLAECLQLAGMPD